MPNRLKSIAVAALLVLVAAPLRAQDITPESVDRFIKGKNAEKPELDKVATQLAELDKKIKDWRDCYGQLREIGQVTGTSPSGFKMKAVTRAKCGATDPDGWIEERGKLLGDPEEAGARVAGMNRGEYAQFKERVISYLGGDRNFGDAALKALNARATDLSNAMGMALAQGGHKETRRRGGMSGGMGSALGNAIGAQMSMFTPDMTWAYVGYLNGILYMSGATMFETDYKAGEWTRWEIKDASQSDQHMVLERAMIRRDADKSEWWRTKTINVTAERADTIVLESQLKPLDADGMTQQVVRMRGKFPGDSVGKELMVPENMNTLSAQAWGSKPTKESIAGATVGTESVTVGNKSYVANHVRFGSGNGDMDWWLTDKVPGGLVRVQSTARGQDAKWTMDLVATGTGAKSELGMK